MGLILDTGVVIRTERQKTKLDFARWKQYGEAAISVITVSELLVGVHRADNETRRARRLSLVESIIAQVPVLDFTIAVSRVHAELFAELSRRGQMIGAHDLIVAATARSCEYAILTTNAAEFRRVPDLSVIEYTDPPAEPDFPLSPVPP
jgi:tRNA(fMet)-specific endonuclease VapC